MKRFRPELFTLKGKEEREITAKRYEEWAKGLWRELFG